MPAFVFNETDFAPPPYELSVFTSISFPLEVDSKSIEKICDDFINTPLRAPVHGRADGVLPRFVPVYSDTERTKTVLLATISHFPYVLSKVKPDLGYLDYTEVALGVGVEDTHGFGTKQRYYNYMPALVLDGPCDNSADHYADGPIIIGRELFGLPKARGVVSFQTGDLTGRSWCLYPAADSNQLMPLKLFLRIEPTAIRVFRDAAAAIRRSLATAAATGASAQIVSDLSNQLAELRRAQKIGLNNVPAADKPFHPLELLTRRWGLGAAKDLANRLLAAYAQRAAPYHNMIHPGPMPADGSPIITLIAALELADQERPDDLSENFVRYQELSVVVARYEPVSKDLLNMMCIWPYAFNYLGLRQLHDVTTPDFMQTNEQRLVRSTFETDAGEATSAKGTYDLQFGPVAELAPTDPTTGRPLTTGGGLTGIKHQAASLSNKLVTETGGRIIVFRQESATYGKEYSEVI